MDNQNSDEHFTIEARSAKAGLSPMFGDWQKTFFFEPVSYASKGPKREEFKSRVQSELTNHFFFSDEVRVEILLYLDIQKIIETSETADLDNYAKSILDGIKGRNGLLFDDSQVQSLCISWIDSNTPERPEFEVKISSSPDSFIPKPAAFYEMADGLWCPFSGQVWDKGEFQEVSERQFFFLLQHEDQLRSTNRKFRHEMRRNGYTTPRSFQFANRFASGFRGFHKSRIDPNFEMVSRSKWICNFDDWLQNNVDEFSELQKILDIQKAHLKRLEYAAPDR